MRDPKAPVTLRHLLTHTSGYGYDIFNRDLAHYIQITGMPSILTLARAIAIRSRLRLGITALVSIL
jgi:methyl acetate hydrolase